MTSARRSPQAWGRSTSDRRPFAGRRSVPRPPLFNQPPPPAPTRSSRCRSFPLGVARGQVAATYIVAEAEDGLVIVDQHAAHERLVLERMRARAARAVGSRARRC